MQQIKIYTIGKVKERWLQEGIQEYTKRLKPSISIEWILAKNTQQLEQLLTHEPRYFSLDPQGKLFTSEAFSLWMEEAFVKGGSRLSLVIGGAEGLSEALKKRSKQLISFSPLTFTHQMFRLLLLEQIYRAFEIKKRSAYHK
jgi:23S rRNA (pseudouridine1915-N3)-methyltransferase